MADIRTTRTIMALFTTQSEGHGHQQCHEASQGDADEFHYRLD